MQASTNPTSVLALLNVQNFRAHDADESSELCKAAAERGNLQLLQWLREHDCAWDASACSTAALNDHLGVLMWASFNSCPWDEDTCSDAAAAGRLHISGHVPMAVPETLTMCCPK
jgi:hypothetical protein